MLKGFREFILRGNLIELAVAFIMAAAFAAVVTATVNLLLTAVAKMAGASQPDFSEFKPGDIPVGAWVNAVISFLILAAVVYFFIVLPYNKLQERRAKGEELGAPSEEVRLLTQIRDLLSEGRTTNQP
jgi:large conductance mechanosensitive channel